MSLSTQCLPCGGECEWSGEWWRQWFLPASLSLVCLAADVLGRPAALVPSDTAPSHGPWVRPLPSMAASGPGILASRGVNICSRPLSSAAAAASGCTKSSRDISGGASGLRQSQGCWQRASSVIPYEGPGPSEAPQSCSGHEGWAESHRAPACRSLRGQVGGEGRGKRKAGRWGHGGFSLLPGVLGTAEPSCQHPLHLAGTREDGSHQPSRREGMRLRPLSGCRRS